MKRTHTVIVYKYLDPQSLDMVENYRSLPNLTGLYYYSKKDADDCRKHHPGTVLTKMKITFEKLLENGNKT